MKTGSTCFSTRSRCLIGLALVAIFLGGPGAARADVAEQFPEVSQVTADYPDDAERYVALNSLWDWMHTKSTSPSAVAKRGTYYNASEAIRTKYMVAGGTAASGFDDRIRQLSFDRIFKRSVLDKYHLGNVAVEQPAAAPQMRNTDVTDSMIEGAFWKASPFLLGSLVMMYLLAKVMMRNSVRTPMANLPRPVAVGHLPQLPESLRVVSLPGMKYTVEVTSGLVLEKETEVHTTYTTTTTPGQPYTIGNEVYTTPGQTSTSASSTKVDTIWLRMLDQRETSWTFTGSGFKVRPGHIISTIGTRLPGGSAQCILAYNHTTNQEEMFGGPHGTRGRWAWLMATLVGSVGFGIWVAIMLSIKPDTDVDAVTQLLSPVADWIEGGIAAAIVAVFVVLKVGGSVMRRRNARFARNYIPGFRQFLEQATTPLQRHFAAG